ENERRQKQRDEREQRQDPPLRFLKGVTITFHLLVLSRVGDFPFVLPAKYSLLFKLFQLPMCSRSAISRMVSVVCRLNRAAMANFSGSVFRRDLRSASLHFSRFNSAAIIRSPL